MTRLAIGPANYAGQAHAWAQAVQRHLGLAAESFNRGPVRRHEFRFETDREIPAPLFFAPLLREARMKRFVSGCTHLAIDGYQTFFQLPQRRDLAADIGFLREQGIQLALIAHGTDIRRPDEHMAANPHSYFREGDEAWRASRRALAGRNNEIAERSGLPLFVSTPDLLADQPGATWLPVCLDPARLATTEPVLERRVPRVLHMPSRAVPPIKGSQYIEPVLHRLAGEGLIEYVQPGRIPHAEVPALLASVDIVVDQLLAGSYGVTAIEAMAAGRVTVCALGPLAAGRIPQRPPLVDATPETLEEQLRALLDDRSAAREKAHSGIDYVRRWHDGRESANALAPWLGVEPRPIA